MGVCFLDTIYMVLLTSKAHSVKLEAIHYLNTVGPAFPAIARSIWTLLYTVEKYVLLRDLMAKLSWN